MNKKLSIGLAGVLALLIMLAFSTTGFNQNASRIKRAGNDTVPTKEKKIKDLDEALLELDNSKALLEQQFKSMDWQKMEKELRNVAKEMDAQKIKMELDKAMQQVDMAKMKAEMNDAVSKVDFEKIKKEMERVKEVDLKKIEVELKNLQPELEKSMNNAKASMEKAKAEMLEYKSFIDGLDKDGMIKKSEPYTIEIQKGKLIINGKEQEESVYNKYRSFLEKHQNETFKKSADSFTIDKD
jgi:hypothetical protein